LPTADLSPYTQPAGTTSDGTKFGNLLTYLQGLLNGLDTNNVAAGAAIKGSQLATGLNGPAGTQLVKDTISANSAAITATTEGTSVAVITGSSFTYDGTSEVKIEFWAPGVNVSVAPTVVTWVLYRDATVVGQALYVGAVSGAVNPSPYVAFHETPTAAAHTYTLKAFVNANSLTVLAGAGGAGALLKAFLKVTKV
jgi:hypothetical protein